MASEVIPIGCDNPGYFMTGQICCYPNNQTQRTCQTYIGPNRRYSLLPSACPSGNCLKDCQDPTLLYGGITTENGTLNTETIQMYMVCAAVPAIAGYEANGVLLPDQAAMVRQFLPPEDATEQNLRRVTATVTDCLTQTCLNSRNESICYEQYCAPGRLLINGTMPNQTAINQCLNKLCTNGFEVVPFGDSDIIGIGVFSSYVVQLILVAVLWFGLVVRAIFRRTRSGRYNAVNQAPEEPTEGRESKRPRLPRESWLRFLVEFHTAQCYFAGTLMIAIFVSGIIKINVAMILLLLPLTTNGVVPVVFAYLMLVYHRASSSALTILTTAVYTLSTVAFWILFANFKSQVTANDLRYNVFAEFMYGISEVESCGGFSALTACSENLYMGREKAIDAARLLQTMPPVAWGISTVVLLGVLVAETRARVKEFQSRAAALPQQTTPKETHADSKKINIALLNSVAFWLTSLALIGCVVMQMSLLSIATTLDMFDPKDWGFGQVIAVTVWVPPVLGYLYFLLRKQVIDMRKRE
nr:uncharacterized protein CTRU02_10190 [Colletotrichum truncatum]KAF6787394.1 hypothetical protein CTRU02_10190 [Colletotrichum truncatum]